MVDLVAVAAFAGPEAAFAEPAAADQPIVVQVVFEHRVSCGIQAVDRNPCYL